MSFIQLQMFCEFTPLSSGIGDFVVGLATFGKSTPEQVNVHDGAVYFYYAQNSDGSLWEYGSGVYTISSHTLKRTTIVANSNDDTNPVNFLTLPIIDVFPNSTGQLDSIKLSVTTTTLTSGSGNYIPPAGVLWIEVHCVAGGGGGGGNDNGTTGRIEPGSDGTLSSFNNVVANPGKGCNGAAANNFGSYGLGGRSGTGTATRRQAGQTGGLGIINPSYPSLNTYGGSTFLGAGAPTPLPVAANINGVDADANTGGGGSGCISGSVQFNDGGGGGGGEYFYLIINSPVGPYPYVVGTGGAGGVGVSNNGGTGGSGLLFILEHYK